MLRYDPATKEWIKTGDSEERQEQYMSLPRKLHRLEQIQMHGKDCKMNPIHICLLFT